jgi:hypothetical protein
VLRTKWPWGWVLSWILLGSIILAAAPPISAGPPERPNTMTLRSFVTASVPGEDDDARIEYEVKLQVPLDQLDEVWAWLQARYADASWLDQGGYVFVAAFGDEDFNDTYFDTPDLRLLARYGGARHRVRVIHSGPAERKDGRQLFQIKLDRSDVTGLARSEIKFQVPSDENDRSRDTTHPMLRLISRADRDEFEATFRALGLDPYEMRPVLTLKQHRRRVYLSDQAGAFATLTLDLCSTDSWGANLTWAEIELELDENRYTEANAAERDRTEQVIEAVQADLQHAFPAIIQDQQPKYNTAFQAIEATTWLPIRHLIQWRMSAADFIVLVLLSLVTIGGAVWYSGRWW